MPIIEVVQRIEVPEIPDIDLPYDDGEPLETNWHRLQINLLGDMLHQHWPERTDFFAGGNMFVYYSLEQARTRDYKGPDFFVVLGVDGTRPRQSWIVWQEEGRYPDVIVELLSPTTISQDLGPKKDLYARVFKTSEYFCVNPDDWSLLGWHLENMHYVALQPDPRGWLWSGILQLWIGIQEGRFQGTSTNWLRFFTPAGMMVPTAEEAAENAHTRAEAERARAEAEQARAEAERARAEAERARAEALEAENTRLRAELERLRGSTP
jgi:Uma2 family endonuclease